ncbi:hypothetical protein C7452_0768 [Methanothermobacter defluvii]|uniref:Uncharacterized protein n=1 Tax=Methanothermobacter defluvii TaxID=49339 RepID=A0A371NE16_9EURY|nr:hypothetical protein C7452_0768 [Methanothermobacter defluvii]
MLEILVAFLFIIAYVLIISCIMGMMIEYIKKKRGLR